MDVEGRLAGLVRVGRLGGQNIDHGVDHAAVTAVLDLLEVLERGVDGFNDGPLMQSTFIDQRHALIAQVLANVGDPTQAPLPTFVEEARGDVPSISDPFARQSLGQERSGLAILDVTGGEAKRQQLSPVVDAGIVAKEKTT